MNPTPEAKYYTVEEGDSLSKISKAMYGDPMKYETDLRSQQADAVAPG